MSVFTEAEIDYLKSQRLGRLATVGRTREGRSHADTVSEPSARRSWVSVLAFIDRIRAIVLDQTLPADEAIAALRSEFRAHGEGEHQS